MPGRLAELREKATASGEHKRTPGIVANLFFGLELFSEFATESKAMTEKQAQAFLDRCWAALGEAAVAQVEEQAHGEATQRFLELLKAALAKGKAHVASPKGNHPENPETWGWREEGKCWIARGVQIGWVAGGSVHLEPEVTFNVAQQLAPANQPLAIGMKTLHKRLHERGLLAQIDETRRRLMIRKTLGGKQREVLHLSAKVLGLQEGD